MNMSMYVAKFRIYEGEHEHRSQFLLTATSHEEAYVLAKSQEHEPDIPDDDHEELACWDYGDGTTASRLESIVAITEEEARILRRLGLAFDFNYYKESGESSSRSWSSSPFFSR